MTHSNTMQASPLVKPSQFDEEQMKDIREGLVFDSEEAKISLHGMPMLLLHSDSFGSLRQELIESLGISKARKMLFRMGHQAGTQDSKVVMKLRAHLTDKDYFMGGPQLHNFTGMTFCKPIFMDIDVAKGIFDMEIIWERSTEAELHIKKYGNHNPFNVCWMQLGYASGYASMVMGRPVLYKEIACKGRGDQQCIIAGKFADAWNKDDLHELYDLHGYNHATIPSSSINKHGNKDLPASMPTNIVGASNAFKVLCHQLKKVSGTDATVLLQGESGVGKELFARQLHDISPRKNHPFISINCAAIPEDILEAELFGVEKGAFTGAHRTRIGKFERANKGTIFLDEIGLLSYSAQGKLLRILQEFEFERLGGENTVKIDIRVIAATNEDLYQLSNKYSRFRKDLFYRLNACPIYIPPLRERASDIPLLMDFFLKKYAKKYNKSITGFTKKTVKELIMHPWEGNIRELENYIERCVILSDDNKAISIDDFPSLQNKTQFKAPPPQQSELKQMSDDIQTLIRTFTLEKNTTTKKVESTETASAIDSMATSKTADYHCKQIFSFIKEDKLNIDSALDQIIAYALEEAHGNISEAARLLGITRARVAHRMKRLPNL